MKIWLFAIGEPLPLPENNDRLHRCGLLAKELSKRGNEVVWWSSTFNHFSKTNYFEHNKKIIINKNLILELLYGKKYKKNISLSRVRNHNQIAKNFLSRVKNYENPDIILCAIPSIELSYEVVKFAKRRDIPLITDARDMWPDIFELIFPKIIRPLLNILLYRLYNKTSYIFKNSSAITGITPGFVDWGISYSKRNKTSKDRFFFLGYPNENYEHIMLKKAWNKLEKKGLSEKDFILTYVGTLAKNKLRLNEIFDLAISLRNNKKIKIVLAGDGDQKLEYIKLTKEKNIQNIIFPGWLNKYEIKALLNYSSLGLVPLKNRVDYIISIPNKPIEYLSSGLPLLSSLSGELENLIKIEKIGFTYSNKNELEDYVRLCLKEKVHKDLVSRCQKVFIERFDAKVVYSNFSDYIENFKN